MVSDCDVQPSQNSGRYAALYVGSWSDIYDEPANMFTRVVSEMLNTVRSLVAKIADLVKGFVLSLWGAVRHFATFTSNCTMVGTGLNERCLGLGKCDCLCSYVNASII